MRTFLRSFCALIAMPVLAGVLECSAVAGRAEELLPPLSETVRTNGLVATFYIPKSGTGPWRPVIVLTGSEGGMYHRNIVVNTLIMCGYCVMAPAYFRETGLPQELISIPLEFFDKTLTWLQNDDRVAQGGVAVVGGSKGGELALLLASRKKEIQAVVAIVPSSYVFKGIAHRPHSSSSWSYEGKDLPCLEYSSLRAWFTYMRTKQFRKVYEAGWRKRARFPEARIPVEKSNAAIFLLSGTNDEMWPSTPMCEEIVQHLKSVGYPHVVEHVAYDCGHAVGKPKEHWVKIKGFLAEHYDSGTRTTK